MYLFTDGHSSSKDPTLLFHYWFMKMSSQPAVYSFMQITSLSVRSFGRYHPQESFINVFVTEEPCQLRDLAWWLVFAVKIPPEIDFITRASNANDEQKEKERRFEDFTASDAKYSNKTLASIKCKEERKRRAQEPTGASIS